MDDQADPAGLDERQILTYRLGRISEFEAELNYQLRDIWRTLYSKSRAEVDDMRLTSGRALKQIQSELAKPRYDWVSECRDALPVIRKSMDARNDALHNEWYLTSNGYVTLRHLFDAEPAVAIAHFEGVAHQLDIAADIAVGIAGLVRETKMHELHWDRGDGSHEANCRALVAKRP